MSFFQPSLPVVVGTLKTNLVFNSRNCFYFTVLVSSINTKEKLVKCPKITWSFLHGALPFVSFQSLEKKHFLNKISEMAETFGLSVSDSETIKLKFLKTLDNEMTCISICVNVLT